MLQAPSRRPGDLVSALMVLVSEKPASAIGMLQTKISYREGHKARRVGEEAMQPDQPIAGCHGACRPRLKIRPDLMHHLLHKVTAFLPRVGWHPGVQVTPHIIPKSPNILHV